MFLLSVFSILAILSWITMGLVWLKGAFGNKQTVTLPNPIAQTIANILLFGSPLFLFLPPITGTWLSEFLFHPETVLGILGCAISWAAVLFAIWARVTLGKNWSGAVITLKKDHELVTNGPYAFVRHPIYTGYFFATLGTALTLGTNSSIIATMMIFCGFLIRMHKEETLMTKQFGHTYTEYKKRSKKIVPFLW